MTLNKILAFFLCLLPCLAPCEFNIRILPLARSCYVEFRLDQILNVPRDLFSPTEHTPLFDVNQKYSATVEWRKKVSVGERPVAFKRGMNFQRVSSSFAGDIKNPPDPRMVTMIMGLNENETYEIKATLSGSSLPVYTDQKDCITRTTDVPTGITVSAVINSSTTKILNSISQQIPSSWDNSVYKNPVHLAGKIVEFQADQKGGTQVFRRGISNGGQTQFQGDASSWFWLRGREGDTIILDGSDPEYDTVGQSKWTPFVDSTHGITNAAKIFRSSALFYDVNNPEKAYDPLNPPALRNIPDMIYYERSRGEIPRRALNISKASDCIKYNSNGTCAEWKSGIDLLLFRQTTQPQEDFFLTDGGYIYLHLKDGRDPNTVYMKIPVITAPLDLYKAAYVKISNLTFQYYRTPGQAGNLSWGGLLIWDTHDLVFQDIIFKGLGHGLGARVGDGSPRRNTIVKHCKFYDGLAPEYEVATQSWIGAKWDDMKAHPEENHAIRMHGVGVSVLDSLIYGYNNGITAGEPVMGTELDPDKITDHPVAWEIDNNECFGISDDCVEVEKYGVGILVTRNKYKATYKGTSMAPFAGGPQYHIRNTFVGHGEFAKTSYKQAPTKFGNYNYEVDSGYKLLANNTFVNLGAVNKPLPEGQPLVGLSSSGRVINLHVFNNYIVSDNFPLDFGDGAFCYPQIFNNNIYYAAHFKSPLLGNGRPGEMADMHGCDIQSDIKSFRDVATFQDWQRGYATYGGSAVPFPGYIASPANLGDYLRSFHDPISPWLHDPDSKFFEGPGDLNDPDNGDFKPRAGSSAYNAGTPLPNITFDLGPAWQIYEEGLHPTIGAISAAQPSLPRAPGNFRILTN